MNDQIFYHQGKLKDYYKTLQIARNAESEVINHAFKALVKKYHPDIGGSIRKMQVINEAFEVLSNHDSKWLYDQLYDRQGRANPDTATSKRPQSRPQTTTVPSSPSGFMLREWGLDTRDLIISLLYLFILGLIGYIYTGYNLIR